MKNKTGFALSELLFVIIVITIVATILFPVFTTAREKAQQPICEANLRQLGTAFAQYVQDNDSLFPCGNAFVGKGWAWGSGCGWAPQLYPYVKSEKAFVCPDDKYRAPSDHSTMSYAINSNLSMAFDPDTYGAVKRLTKMSKLRAPAATVLLSEVSGCVETNLTTDALYEGYCATLSPSGNAAGGGPVFLISGLVGDKQYAQWDTGPIGAYPFGTHANPTFSKGTIGNGTASPRHGSGANWLAADGHVIFLSGDKVSGGYNATFPSDQAEFTNGGYFAAGTSNLTEVSGKKDVLTFSLI